MKYPKQVMKKSELVAMGFTDEYLMYVYRNNRNAIAWKMNPTKVNSTICLTQKNLRSSDRDMRNVFGRKEARESEHKCRRIGKGLPAGGGMVEKK